MVACILVRMAAGIYVRMAVGMSAQADSVVVSAAAAVFLVIGGQFGLGWPGLGSLIAGDVGRVRGLMCVAVVWGRGR